MANTKSGTRIRSVAEFVSKISSGKPAGRRLYRGQAEDWALLPKIARLQFREFSGEPAYNIEVGMFNEFTRLAHPYLPLQKWTIELLAIAQHHGLPTRLLDWSTNALIALWFAVRESSVKEEDAVVWLLDVAANDMALRTALKTSDSGDRSSILNIHDRPFETKATQIYAPPNVSERVTAQGGYFTIHARDSKSAKFVPLEHDDVFEKFLTKYTIAPNYHSEIREQLDECGINSSLAFPGLVGICDHITWKRTHAISDAEPDSII